MNGDRTPLKRAPALVPLSSEHHQALLLAFQCKKAAAGVVAAGAAGEPAEQVRRVERAFADVLEAHFLAEEELLAPPLAEHLGEAHPELLRLVEDHVELQAARRALADAPAPELPPALGRFGALLEAHVRWEERTLFPLAEQFLTADELKRLEAELPAALSPAACPTPK